MEAWLSGPVPDVMQELQPAAHIMLQARTELTDAIRGLDRSQLWLAPGGAASIAFHARHVCGAIDRLLTYARGQQLDDAQRAALAAEQHIDPQLDAAQLVDAISIAVEKVLYTYRTADRFRLYEPRHVGRAKLPSSTMGLLYHIAEHSVRHAGQVVTTSKIVRSQSISI